MSKATTIERNAAIDRLREVIKPGDAVRCILRHVSASGMSRTIDLIHISNKGAVSRIGYNAAQAIGWTYDRKHEGVRVKGCGMDMGYHLVSMLSYALYGNESSLESRWL